MLLAIRFYQNCQAAAYSFCEHNVLDEEFIFSGILHADFLISS